MLDLVAVTLGAALLGNCSQSTPAAEQAPPSAAQSAARDAESLRPVRAVTLESGSVNAEWGRFQFKALRTAGIRSDAQEDSTLAELREAWEDERTNWFDLSLRKSDGKVRAGLTAEGVTFAGGKYQWPDECGPTPHLVDFIVLDETLHLLAAGSTGAIRSVSITLAEGSLSIQSQVIPTRLLSGGRPRAMCWVFGVSSPQIAVFWTIDEDESSSEASLSLGTIETDVWPTALTPVLPLQTEAPDQQALLNNLDWWERSASVARSEEQIVAILGLEAWAGGIGAVVQWNATKASEQVQRSVKTWDGTAGLGRGRHTGLGGVVVMSAPSPNQSGRIYSAAPHAGLESAVLSFEVPSLKLSSIRHPIPDRWSDGARWTRMSPSTVPPSSDVYMFVDAPHNGSASLRPGATGSILRMHWGLRGLVSEVR